MKLTREQIDRKRRAIREFLDRHREKQEQKQPDQSKARPSDT